MVYLADDGRDRRVAAGSPLAVRIIERDTLWRSFPPRLTTTGVSATTNSVTIEPDRMAVRADMPSRAGRDGAAAVVEGRLASSRGAEGDQRALMTFNTSPLGSTTRKWRWP
jgi:hypothetical protein